MSTERTLEAIADCTDEKLLEQWVKNARRQGNKEVERTAFRRLIEVSARHHEPGTLEHDWWQSLHAAERLFKMDGRVGWRRGRTRQKVARVGEKQVLIDWALYKGTTETFEWLMEQGYPELTGEALVVRHAHQFEPHVVEAAQRRLDECEAS